FDRYAPAVPHWLDAAGISIEPRGVLSQRVASRLPGMGERFGVYDAAQERLTDLGRALSYVDREYVDRERDQASPFSWPSPVRYIGLRILLGADGDLVLELLRAFPEEGTLDEPLTLVADSSRRLLERAELSEQQRELRRLIDLTSTQDREAKGKA